VVTSLLAAEENKLIRISKNLFILNIKVADLFIDDLTTKWRVQLNKSAPFSPVAKRAGKTTHITFPDDH
jgi:hypothetical protein